MRQQLLMSSLEEESIAVLRENANPEKPYFVAYSGGKDSDVLLDIVKRSGVEFQAVYSLVCFDPPELKRHVVEMKRDPANRLSIRPPLGNIMEWAKRKKLMPLRNARWCCEILKEWGNADGITITGIRWGESNRRAKRKMLGEKSVKRGEFVHPIIFWATSDVWSYIRLRKLSYCSLYDEGWKRLGCVMCPMGRGRGKCGREQLQREMDRFPFAVSLWRQMSHVVWQAQVEAGMDTFATEEEHWQWWLDRDAKLKKHDTPLFPPPQ